MLIKLGRDLQIFGARGVENDGAAACGGLVVANACFNCARVSAVDLTVGTSGRCCCYDESMPRIRSRVSLLNIGVLTANRVRRLYVMC